MGVAPRPLGELLVDVGYALADLTPEQRCFLVSRLIDDSEQFKRQPADFSASQRTQRHTLQ
jgi:hypothetical protein